MVSNNFIYIQYDDNHNNHIYKRYDQLKKMTDSGSLQFGQGYYNMNKNNSNTHNLNTINIFYRPFNNQHTQNLLNEHNRHTPQKHPKTNLFSHENSETFNDTKLKYGKSQTLKESTFNRQRIYIYRRQKKQKWIDLLQKNLKQEQQISYSQPRDNFYRKQQFSQQRENKTSIKKKRPKDFIQRNLKNKTNSSQNQEQLRQQCITNPNSFCFTETAKQKFLQHVRHKKEEGNVSQLINFNTLKFGFHLKKQMTLIEKRKRRNLSDNFKQLQKNKSPNTTCYPPQVKIHMFNNHPRKMQVVEESKQQTFQAWQIGDILASKHGIVEYIDQQTLQKPQPSKKPVGPQKVEKKYRKRITLRNFKQ